VVDQFSLAILYEENEIVKGSPNMIKELWVVKIYSSERETKPWKQIRKK
jgi:hypothetical protein